MNAHRTTRTIFADFLTPWSQFFRHLATYHLLRNIHTSAGGRLDERSTKWCSRICTVDKWRCSTIKSSGCARRRVGRSACGSSRSSWSRSHETGLAWVLCRTPNHWGGIWRQFLWNQKSQITPSADRIKKATVLVWKDISFPLIWQSYVSVALKQTHTQKKYLEQDNKVYVTIVH